MGAPSGAGGRGWRGQSALPTAAEKRGRRIRIVVRVATVAGVSIVGCWIAFHILPFWVAILIATFVMPGACAMIEEVIEYG